MTPHSRPKTDREPGPEIVFTSARADLIAVAKSILMSSGIDFGTRGEHVQELFGLGRFPAGYNLAMGPVQILVPARDAADARALLAAVGATGSTAFPPGFDAPGDAHGPEYPSRPFWRDAKENGRYVALAVVVYQGLQLAFGAALVLFSIVSGLISALMER